jgi:hypothetical protein
VNASQIAIDTRGAATYVEGIAFPSKGCFPNLALHHAWITLDGKHAVDPTWPTPGTAYVGIAVPTKQLARLVVKGGFGCMMELIVGKRDAKRWL